MKVAVITPGSGGSFYCENCLRDAWFVDALRLHGHDAVVVPMYLPFFLEEPEVRHPVKSPLFFGGVRIFLRHKMPLLKSMPGWFNRILDARFVLKLAAACAGSTRADNLDALTISMLRGESGGESDEIARMISWMDREWRPDVVHLSNALLLGLAGSLKARLGCPVVCSLQDEDAWVDAMSPESAASVWEHMMDNCRHIDMFVSVSDYYAGLVAGRLCIPMQKMRVVRPCVDLSKYSVARHDGGQLSIGFMARMNYDSGLDILARAFVMLRGNPAFQGLKLVLTGGATGDDKRFVESVRQLLGDHDVLQYVEIERDMSAEGRRRFLAGLSVFCVPARTGNAIGLYLLEAMSSGVPVVQPDLGGGAELVGMTGGGELFAHGDVDSLASAIAGLLADPGKRQRLGARGRASVDAMFNSRQMADSITRIYSECL